jgi:hypothetical protein
MTAREGQGVSGLVPATSGDFEEAPENMLDRRPTKALKEGKDTDWSDDF